MKGKFIYQKLEETGTEKLRCIPYSSNKRFDVYDNNWNEKRKYIPKLIGFNVLWEWKDILTFLYYIQCTTVSEILICNLVLVLFINFTCYNIGDWQDYDQHWDPTFVPIHANFPKFGNAKKQYHIYQIVVVLPIYEI